MNKEYSIGFTQKYKKLHKSEQDALVDIVEHITNNPTIGELKTGKLSGLRVFKKHINNQLTLISYTYCDRSCSCYFYNFGTHENFYRDLKKYLK